MTQPASAATYPPSAPLVLPNTVPAAPGQLGLTAQELAFFHERGYVVKRGLIARERIRQIETELGNIHERMDANAPEMVWVSWEEGVEPGKPRKIRQLMNSEVIIPAIDAVSRSEEVLAIMRQLIGPDVYLFHSKLMAKAARDGSFTPWHQDFQYWQYETKQPCQVNCMLSIDASDDANGALRVVEGSHKRGLQPAKHFKSDSFSIGLDGDLGAYESVLIDTQPGDAIFFGAYVIHGSGPNTSDRNRCANTFAYDRPRNRLKDGEEYQPRNWRCGAKVN